MARLSEIAVGDRVRVNHKGRTTWATVSDKRNGIVHINPDNPRFTWREITAKEVTEIISQTWSPANAVFR